MNVTKITQKMTVIKIKSRLGCYQENIRKLPAWLHLELSCFWKSYSQYNHINVHSTHKADVNNNLHFENKKSHFYCITFSNLLWFKNVLFAINKCYIDKKYIFQMNKILIIKRHCPTGKRPYIFYKSFVTTIFFHV